MSAAVLRYLPVKRGDGDSCLLGPCAQMPPTVPVVVTDDSIVLGRAHGKAGVRVAGGLALGTEVFEHNLPCRACGWLPVHPHCLLGVAECFLAESFHPQSFGREVGLPMA